MKLDKKKLSQLIMELFANPELKQRFLKDPANVLKEKSFDIPGDTEIRVVEDTKTVKHIVLPYIEPGEKLIPEELEARISKVVPPG
ncbi:MAG: nitrile hydratase subunit alpha [Candidatus Cloacimonetes bacterium]|nr:nitrile hydratase subunit alpha [Candidatus Cloacimonadota bacterium]